MEIELTRSAKQRITTTEREIFDLYGKMLTQSMSPFQIREEIKQILLKHDILRCWHPNIQNFKCVDCGTEMPTCPSCNQRKWLFSDYNMCGDCWSKCMEGQYVVDG